MDNSVICWRCRIHHSVTQYTQAIRCYKCREVISLSKDDQVVSTKTCTRSTQEHAKSIMTFKICRSNCRLHTDPPHTLLDPISTWEAKSGKRALLCGVTYTDQKFKLKGTTNDVTNMENLLVGQYKFPCNSIRILAETTSHHHPTKRNIQEALRWLVKDSRSGDSLVFYFSGHGLRQPDFSNDELDGFDETICPLDFKTAGMILDNELNETIVRPLPKGVILHAIIDACHSGTILDLVHVYNPKTKQWVDNYPPSGACKGTSGGLAISFSACEDDQLAADTTAFSDNGKQMEGAMTSTFSKTVRENPRVTYVALLASMHKVIMEARKGRRFRLRRLFHRETSQGKAWHQTGKLGIRRCVFLIVFWY